MKRRNLKLETKTNPRQDVKNAVNLTVRKVRDHPDSPSTKALLAKLRRGAGKPPGSTPEIFDVTLGSLPESAGEYEENAVYTALTLFGVQEQGGAKYTANAPVKFGAAIRKLAKGDGNGEIAKDGATRRFNSLLAASTLSELSVHARGLVKQCKSAGAFIDFVEFAADLYDWQFDKSKTAQKWGREFWRVTKINEDEINEIGENNL